MMAPVQPSAQAHHQLAAERAALEQTFGTVRVWDRRLFVLDAIARERHLADQIAAQARTRGRLARVTQVGERGIQLGDGRRVKDVWVVWTGVRRAI